MAQCPKGKKPCIDNKGVDCVYGRWGVDYEGWCCNKSDIELIIDDCGEDPSLKAWRETRSQFQDVWRSEHEKLTWTDYNDNDDGIPGTSMELNKPYQTIMDFYMGKAYTSRWAEDAADVYTTNFDGGYAESATGGHYEWAKEHKNKNILRNIACLALIISHFFHVNKTRATEKILLYSINQKNKFVKALAKTAQDSLDFYEANSDLANFSELYEEIDENWRRVTNDKEKMALYIQHLENFTPEVVGAGYEFITKIVKRTCDITSTVL